MIPPVCYADCIFVKRTFWIALYIYIIFRPLRLFYYNTYDTQKSIPFYFQSMVKGCFRSPLSMSINLFREKFHFDLIAVPCSTIAHRGGAEMKFFADFTPFSARYCIIAVRARRRIYGQRAINSKQYLAENRLFRQSEGCFRSPFISHRTYRRGH